MAWTSNDGSYDGVFAQRFSSAGARLAGEFQVNTYTDSYQYEPSVAVAASGDFVIVWGSYQDGQQCGIFLQRFSSAGTRLGGELQVNVVTLGAQFRPAVAAQVGGGFVVVWSTAGQDAEGRGTFARLFSSAGAALAGEFRVSTFTPNDALPDPAVAADADGDFVVTWMSSQDGSFDSVMGRRFSSAGVALTGEIQINAVTLDFQRKAMVASEGDGDFIVTWHSTAQDGSGIGVFARRFSSAGTAPAIEQQVNDFTPGDQSFPSVDTASSGSFVVAWQSNVQDGDGAGIFARRFGGPILLDVDGNGSARALTDGLLALRYLLGSRGWGADHRHRRPRRLHALRRARDRGLPRGSYRLRAVGRAAVSAHRSIF